MKEAGSLIMTLIRMTSCGVWLKALSHNSISRFLKWNVCIGFIVITTVAACGYESSSSGRKACEVVTKAELIKVFPGLTISDGAASVDKKSSSCLYVDAKLLYKGPQIDISVHRDVGDEDFNNDRARSLKAPNRKVINIPHLGDRAYSEIIDSTDGAVIEVLYKESSLRVSVMSAGAQEKALALAKAGLTRL